MKTILASSLLLLTGCAGISGYNASEVHVTSSYPLIWTDKIDASGISKETTPEGKVVRKAKELTHTTTAGGFTRTVVAKDAEITSDK